MGFSGRCEAIKAPTTENDTVQVGRTANEGPSQARKISPRVRPLRSARIRLAAASARHSRHSDQTSHGAAGGHPPDRSSLFPRYSRHNPTLLHYRLLNVSTNVTMFVF